jgi:hypothetical protein
MAEMTIRLERDAATGKRNIVVTLRRDDDLLPHEHEERHRALVEKLIGQGLISAAEAGQVIVERDGEPAATAANKQPEPQRAAQAEGSR